MAGCGGDGEKSGGAEAKKTTTAAETPARQKEPLSIGLWRSRYSIWLDEIRGALTTVGLMQHDEIALRALRESPDDEAGQTFKKNLESVLECGGLEETLLPAPKRVSAAARLLIRSCAHFKQGARLLQGGVDHEDGELFDRSVAEFRIAANLVQTANSRLRRPERTEALPLPVEAGETEISRIEPRLTRIANANRDLYAPARCWSANDWTRIEDEEFGKRVNLAGFASLEYGSLNLSPLVCDALARIAYTDERPKGVEQLEIAFAFVVLMHETSHLADGGQFSSTIGKEEPAAECWGMQFVKPAAEALGAGKEYAAELAERYWTEVYPHIEAKYRSPECRNGGKLDARPTTEDWP